MFKNCFLAKFCPFGKHLLRKSPNIQITKDRTAKLVYLTKDDDQNSNVKEHELAAITSTENSIWFLIVKVFI